MCHLFSISVMIVVPGCLCILGGGGGGVRAGEWGGEGCLY